MNVIKIYNLSNRSDLVIWHIPKTEHGWNKKQKKCTLSHPFFVFLSIWRFYPGENKKQKTKHNEIYFDI